MSRRSDKPTDKDGINQMEYGTPIVVNGKHRILVGEERVYQ